MRRRLLGARRSTDPCQKDKDKERTMDHGTLALMIPITVIVLGCVIAFGAIYWDYRKKQLQSEERRLTIEKGMMPEEAEKPVSPAASLRRGAIALCVGIGLGISAVILRYWGDKDAPPVWVMGVVAAIVGLVG